ncbi:MAG: VOC family protein [Kiloniellales bacterium]|nr:VOC family protein [Kiloniellales bacterium]
MTDLTFDHLVIGAADLAQGVDWVEARLGVTVPPGGSHPRMATHNRLSALGPASFLEIIALDPAAEAPPRPRWFALDDPAVRARLARRPRLLTWVAGTDDIAASLARARAAGLDLGRPVEMTRGDLTWLISLRDDGALVEGGTLPVLIQWPPGPHPAGRMTDQGLRLEALELGHPDPDRLEAVRRVMRAGRLATVVRGEQPSLRAVLRTSDGARLRAARDRAEIS